MKYHEVTSLAICLATSILFLPIVESSSSLATRIDCSAGPTLSVASFGEYIWNCSSSSTGSGDVLRIVVPSSSVALSGLLSVEVRLGTFQQIVVDLSNVVRPQSNVNVTIVLCGALLGRTSTNVLNLTDQPLTAAITITGVQSHDPGVIVAVVVDRDARLWMRNVASLILVEPLLANSSQVLRLALELRSGCVVELYDVPHFVSVGRTTNLLFTAVNANFQTIFTALTPFSGSTSVLNSEFNSTDGSDFRGLIDVSVSACTFSILRPSLLDASFVLISGDKVSTANVAVSFANSNLTIESGFGNVVTVKGNTSATVFNLSVNSYGTTVVCSGNLIYVSANGDIHMSRVSVVVRSKSIVTGIGRKGALLDMESSNGTAVLSNAVAAVESDSTVDFDGQWFLVFVSALGPASIRCVSTSIRSSCITVRSVGALLFIKSFNDVVDLWNATAIAENCTVIFTAQGNLVNAWAKGSISANSVTTTLHFTNLSAGGNIDALLFISSSSDRASLANVTAAIVRSTVCFAGQGFLIFVVSVNSATVTRSTTTVSYSNVTVSGSLGALFDIQSSSGSVVISNATAIVGGSIIDFAGEGFLFLAVCRNSLSAMCMNATVNGSSMNVRGATGGLILFQSNGDVLLSNATATVADVTASFSQEKALFYVWTVGSLSARLVTVTMRSTNVAVSGIIGTLLYLQSSSDAVNTFMCDVTIDGGSNVTCARQCITIFTIAPRSVSASCITATVASSSRVTVGSKGALLFVKSPNGSVNLVNVTATVEDRSFVAFDGEGYLVWAIVGSSSSASGVATTVRSNSSMTVRGPSGALFLMNCSADEGPRSVSDVLLIVCHSNVLFLSSGRLGHFQLPSNVAQAEPQGSWRVVVVGSAVLVSEVLKAPALCNNHVEVRESVIVVSGVEVMGPTIELKIDNAMLLVSPWSLDQMSPPPSSKSFALPSIRGVFSSNCGLIGWHYNFSAPNISSSSSIEWALGVAQRFAHGHLGDLSFPFRALRKLDVVGADRVAVTAERCAWGRGSHEFRATDSASASASRSPSHSIDDTTMTLLSSITLSKQQLAVVKRYIVADGIGSTVLFVSIASSVASTSVSTVVPGIQAIGQRYAARWQCDLLASNSDGLNALSPPMSDAASNPFGLILEVMGNELMFAGGSIVSSILLALIYATAVAAPQLQNPCEWLRDAKKAPMAVLRLPGSLYAPLALVLQPLIAAAVVLIASSARGTASVALGSVMLILTLTALIKMLWEVREGGRHHLLRWQAKSKQHVARHYFVGVAVELATTVFDDRYEWFAANNTDAAQRHFQRYGAVVESYVAGRERFVGVEVAAAVISGALVGVASALDPSLSCSAAVIDGINWALVALCLTLFVTVAAWLPYSSHFGNALSGVSSLLAATCLALQSLFPDSPVIAAFTWSQSILGFLPLIYFFPIAVVSLFALPRLSSETRADDGESRDVVMMGVLIVTTPCGDCLGDDFAKRDSNSPSAPRMYRRRPGQRNLVPLIETICARRKRGSSLIY